jgi:hypothetical protein
MTARAKRRWHLNQIQRSGNHLAASPTCYQLDDPVDRRARSPTGSQYDDPRRGRRAASPQHSRFDNRDNRGNRRALSPVGAESWLSNGTSNPPTVSLPTASSATASIPAASLFTASNIRHATSYKATQAIKASRGSHPAIEH